jgi:hypothetical protein
MIPPPCPRCRLLHPAGHPCLTLSLAPGDDALLVPGTVLANRYRIVDTLARGGTSVVYRADDLVVQGRRVALKELRLDPIATAQERAEAEAWFAREAGLLSGLCEPRIPAFYGAFRDNGRSYLAQEYVRGVSLEAVLQQRGHLAEATVLAWGRALSDLLRHLHGRPDPVIFRDLKPANILLRLDGRLVVVDFGIARTLPVAARALPGTTIGTPGYAPPEQYQGLADERSDIYALGATLHRLLTGYDPEQGPPFTFPPVRDLNPRVSPALAAVVARAVALDPAARFGTAGEFRRALDTLPLRRAATAWWGIGSAMGALVVSATLLLALPASHHSPPAAMRPVQVGAGPQPFQQPAGMAASQPPAPAPAGTAGRRAATYTLTSCTEAALRRAIDGAEPGDRVVFGCSGTITLSRTIGIRQGLTFDGGGHAVTIGGSGAAGASFTNRGPCLTLTHLTIAYGSGAETGIANYGTLTINNSTLIGTGDGSGIGIENHGTLHVNRSTFSGDKARGPVVVSFGMLIVTNSTIRGNSAGTAAGVQYLGGIVQLTHSTIYDYDFGAGTGAKNFGTIGG